MFNNCDDWKPFKATMRDLLISMKSFSSQQQDFYEHQKKEAKEKAERKRQEMLQKLSSINGQGL